MKEIKNKIKALLDRVQFKSTDRQLSDIKQFMTEEFLPDRKPLEISAKDLLQIRSLAIDKVISMRTDLTINGKSVIDNEELVQSYAYFYAVYCFFKGNKVLFHDIRIGDEKDENERNSS